MLSFDEALQAMLSAVNPIATEVVTIHSCSGRVCARPLSATRALPGFANSAMDGYAVRRQDLPGELVLQGVVPAGGSRVAIKPGHAVRIFTGAPVPDGADAVVMQENVVASGERVKFAEVPPLDDNIRGADNDVSVGDNVIARGDIIGPGRLALLAALGVSQLEVFARPSLALVSTGSELCKVGEVPAFGQVVSTNGMMLAAQLKSLYREHIDLECADEPLQLRQTLTTALESADVVITSGGASVGDKDLVRPVLKELGAQFLFEKVAIKPGKPVGFALVEGKPVLCLPGNPASCFVTAELFARPLISALEGDRSLDARRWQQGKLDHDYTNNSGRAHYLRGQWAGHGAVSLPKQGSGQLTSVAGANALVEIPAASGTLAAGHELRVLRL